MQLQKNPSPFIFRVGNDEKQGIRRRQRSKNKAGFQIYLGNSKMQNITLKEKLILIINDLNENELQQVYNFIKASSKGII